jgi:aryl-alcohol dehydrogenase-like predicted oxidoreductase
VRDRVRVIAGSYHASPAAIEADVDTALRRLRRDRIDAFLLFWTRSAERLAPELHACLARLKQAGKIGAAGFSTHHRDLARAALAEQPWDLLMIRHSAAHPGAEEALLGEAAARGVGVLTFTALCYGRLLQPSPDQPAPGAADCYRYSLSQPGVTAVLSAPAHHRELVDNLAVLPQPTLAADRLDALRAHGRWVYAQSKDFGALVRRTPRALPAAAERLIGLLDDLAARPRF